MTIEIRPPAVPATDLAGFLAAMERQRFAGDEEAAYVEAAPLLAALAADRTFLGDLMIAELKGRAYGQERDNDYGPQVILLHRGPGWFLRANIWPDTADPLYRTSGPARFFYGVPHDHNFHFLTAGYFGPGYWSDYYRYDHHALLGHEGERARLRFVERSRLGEGRLLFYRAHEDVHNQLPPDSLSVSLNIVEGTAGVAFLDQYRFDVDRDLIAGQLAYSPTEALIALLPAVGGEEGRDLLDRFAARHPSHRIRFGAIAALASTEPEAARIARMEHVAAGSVPAVAALARARLATIAAGQGWRERNAAGTES